MGTHAIEAWIVDTGAIDARLPIGTTVHRTIAGATGPVYAGLTGVTIDAFTPVDTLSTGRVTFGGSGTHDARTNLYTKPGFQVTSRTRLNALALSARTQAFAFTAGFPFGADR